jgi:hypothetical protein
MSSEDPEDLKKAAEVDDAVVLAALGRKDVLEVGLPSMFDLQDMLTIVNSETGAFGIF